MVSKTSSEESLTTASIEEWADSPTPDHARALIRLYKESEWRSTRLEVLRSLGRFQDSRSLQFLIEIAEKNEDLSEQQLAILAISQRKTKTAQVFLKNFYLNAPDTLKPHLAYALGQAQDFTAIPYLLKDWDHAYSRQDWLWFRNIILSLGDLKAHEALPKIRSLFTRHIALESEITLALLFAMARLERDPVILQPLERNFSEDSLLFQVFQSTLSQVQIRSQFKLEDYLGKIFTLAHPHPILPLELKSFEVSEVELGLSIFSIEQDWKRYLLALSGVPAAKRVPYLEKIIQILTQRDDQVEYLDLASKLLEDSNQALILKVLEPFSKSKDLELKLKWLECVAQYVDLATFAKEFLTGSDQSLAIQYLNLWSEWNLIKHAAKKADASPVLLVHEWRKNYKMSPQVYARLMRACAELGIEAKEIAATFTADFKDTLLRSSLLMFIERFPKLFDFKMVVKEVLLLSAIEQENLGPRILAVFEAFSHAKAEMKLDPKLNELLKTYGNHFNIELRVGVLKFLRNQPYPEWEGYVLDQVTNQNPLVQLNSVISLKSYAESKLASEVLGEQLKSTSKIVQGRALDALCAHSSLTAKRAVIAYVETNLEDEVVVDKVYRSFDPMKKGGQEFVKAVDTLLNKNPDHPSWEKLVSLRDRLSLSSAEHGFSVDLTKEAVNPALKEMDQALIQVIPHFHKLDSMTQSALRAAETPFLLALDQQNLPVDKAPTVLEYCKALDLILERNLGQKHLFSKLDTQLHDFQTLWHRVGFQEDYPSSDKVMTLLGLKGKITPEHFPLHKAKMMCGTFFNGKILQDRFKVFDGLRAWAVIFLVFTRKIPLTTGSVGPLLKLPNVTDEKCISVAKRLMLLQDLRNPAAHRQTYTDLASVQNVRNEAILLLNTILEMVL